MDRAQTILKDFMREHGIWRPNKILRLIERRTGRFVCANNLAEYEKTNKKISVIVPVCGMGKYFKRTLDSVRFQTYENLEIICVLPCPSDDDTAIVESIVAEDGRIRILRYEAEAGLSESMNIGVRNATGEYVHFMSVGDFICPDFYDNMIGAAVSGGADAVASSVFCERNPQKSIWVRESKSVEGGANIKSVSAISDRLWRYLLEKSFWDRHSFTFPNATIRRGMPIVDSVISHANRVAYCSSVVYIHKIKMR